VLEVARLGFDKVVVPEGTRRGAVKQEGIQIIPRRLLDDAIDAALT
jgi:hypothetical protein